MFANQIPLKRSVVHEHHGIETDVQCLLDQFDVINLVVPVSNEDCDVIEAKRHPRMIAKHFFCSLLLVLAANRENDSALLEFPRPLLERIERMPHPKLAELNIFHTLIPDHSPPNRIVEIENQTLPNVPADGLDDIHDRFGDRRKKL